MSCPFCDVEKSWYQVALARYKADFRDEKPDYFYYNHTCPKCYEPVVIKFNKYDGEPILWKYSRIEKHCVTIAFYPLFWNCYRYYFCCKLMFHILHLKHHQAAKKVCFYTRSRDYYKALFLLLTGVSNFTFETPSGSIKSMLSFYSLHTAHHASGPTG